MNFIFDFTVSRASKIEGLLHLSSRNGTIPKELRVLMSACAPSMGSVCVNMAGMNLKSGGELYVAQSKTASFWRNVAMECRCGCQRLPILDQIQPIASMSSVKIADLAFNLDFLKEAVALAGLSLRMVSGSPFRIGIPVRGAVDRWNLRS